MKTKKPLAKPLTKDAAKKVAGGLIGQPQDKDSCEAVNRKWKDGKCQK